MNIAITGHTSGIGRALKEYFEAEGHQVLGFSRATGHNITASVQRQAIADAAEHCDIFINNAYNDFDSSQLEMLKLICTRWTGLNKIVFNVGSRIGDYDVPSTAVGLKLYQHTKQAQDAYCAGRTHAPQVVNLRLGRIDTPRIQSVTDAKLSTEKVVDIVKFVLEHRGEFCVSSISVGPQV